MLAAEVLIKQLIAMQHRIAAHRGLLFDCASVSKVSLKGESDSTTTFHAHTYSYLSASAGRILDADHDG